MTVSTPEGTWVVPPQKAVFIPAGVEFGLRLHGSVSMSFLYYKKEAYFPFSSCRVLSVTSLLKELIAHAVAVGMLRESVPHEKRVALLINDLLCSAPLIPMQMKRSSDRRIKELEKMIEEEPACSSSLELLAQKYGSSKRTLERLIHQEFGLSFGKWRQQLRMHEAIKMLASGKSITEVALDVGYSTPSAFSFSFRETFGTTPRQYFNRD